MERLIYRDEALSLITDLPVSSTDAETLQRCIEVISNMPTVDAVPVKHGRWIKKRYWSEGVGMGERYGYWYACSKCDHEVKGGYDSCGDRFCSECGARMT